MRLGAGYHLSYCTNIHRGESFAELEQSLYDHIPGISARVAPGEPFGLGLRLSARAALELEEPRTFERLLELLEKLNAYVFTLNGFPYGPFHGVPVKEAVYQPDWRTSERSDYTTRLARLLVRLRGACPSTPETLSISTVPGGFRYAGAPEMAAEVARRLIEQATVLHRMEEATGTRIVLALEPEPACLMETTEECVTFLQEHVFSCTNAVSEDILRRHLGLCLDTCHAAVQYETPQQTLATIQSSGLVVGKIQVTTGLSVPKASLEARERLAEFCDGIYLHQGSVRLDDTIARFVDLPDALARPDFANKPWRVHFHVPVFQNRLGIFENTQAYLRAILAAQRAAPLSQHLEVETYTFDVLPERFKGSSLMDAICRELEWTRKELKEPQG